MSELHTPKNITQLKHIIAQSSKISITGFLDAISITQEQVKSSVLIDISKIRECNYTLKSTHSSILGVNNSVARLLSYASQGLIASLLQQCLVESYYIDTWNISLLQAVFGKDSPPLCRLFLIMVNAHVQVVSDTLSWIPIRELFAKNAPYYLHNCVPIQIRMDVFPNSQHTLTAPSFARQITTIPSFSKPIILGQIVLRTLHKEISNMQLLYAHQETIILFEPYLTQVIGSSPPMLFSEITKIFSVLPTTNIAPQHLQYLLQSITSLLHPNFA